jgi:hypothetical protein
MTMFPFVQVLRHLGEQGNKLFLTLPRRKDNTFKMSSFSTAGFFFRRYEGTASFRVEVGLRPLHIEWSGST